MQEKKLHLIFNNENIEEMKDYLSGYKLCRDLLELEKYEREFLRSREWAIERPGDLSLARAKMFEIRHFILELPNSNEKILLYLHYIDCEPIERCGDIMGISRSSAFRLKRRALSLALSVKNGEVDKKTSKITKNSLMLKFA
ncbi:MAG: hypothetical protein J6U68_04425 [Clostridia bacterium]|nr:hypothetical protein [Clostridia bacterium]